MISQESVIKRLAVAKYLYKIGYDQSQLSEGMAFPCLLSFHDAVEIFLRLTAEKENINSDKFRFLEYWEKIPSLTLKESMNNLNIRRVNLKHKGILPAKQDLEITRVNVTDFFEQNTIAQFGIDFKDISLINLIAYPTVRQYLEISQTALNEFKLPDAVENAAYAFHELLYTYEQSKIGIYHKSPFYFGDKMNFWARTYENLEKLDRDLTTNLRNMKNSIEALQDSMKIMCLGIDYRKYAMFKLLTPVVTHIGDQYYSELRDDKKWTSNNTQFCIDFVIESSIKLQDFDFDIEHLIDNEPPTLEYVSGDFENGIIFQEVPRKDN
jgi:hypothetical protein